MDRNEDPNNLSSGEVVFLDNDYQFYLQEHNEENPRIYLEDEDNLGFMEDEPHDDNDGDHREVVEHPIRRQSENDLEHGSINGVPMNTTGPRTPSHNEIHEKVTHCLKSSKNLLVECPTVLKRRFKILTGVLDYFQWKRNDANSKDLEHAASPTPSIIYFATRSFEESKTVLKEIKEHFTSSGHLSNLNISILDSRKNLCINEEINSAPGEYVDWSCMQMTNNFNYNVQTFSRGMNVGERPTCEYYCNVRPREQLFSFREENPDSNTVQDIEDFISNGQLNRQCPYFDSKQIHREAEFVICPQEFIISPLHRLDYDISLEKAIIIFDDGFDIENVFYKQGSINVSLSETNIFTQILRSITGQDIGRPADFCSLLEHIATSIEAWSRWIQEEIHNEYKPKHGEIMEALRNHGYFLDYSTIKNLVIFLGDIQTNPKVIIPTPTHVITLRKFIYLITMASQTPEDFFMKVRKGGGDHETVLEILLTNPKVLFDAIGNNALSIIIGSSCIAPFETFNLEFGTPFQKVKYERDDEGLLNGHLLAYCSEGPSGTSFELDYDSRDNPAVINEIGEAIIKICEKVPGGIIVVFHAESYFKNVVKEWRTHSILSSLQRLKHVFSELDMTTPESTEVLLSSFRECCERNPSSESSQSGAVLLITRKGKVYHQLECLRGAEKRAIINVSIPYGAWGVDKLVIAKRFMFEQRHGISKPPENHDWYESEAFRKLNQSFSYSVQDKEWGIVVVFDKRMHSRRYKFDNLLPAWVKNRYRRNGFPQLMDAITKLVEAQEGNGN